MDFQALKYIYKRSGNAAAFTLLLLHGTGGNENDLLPLTSHLDTGFNILSVRGNVSENDMPRFFKRIGMGVFDEEDLAFRTDELVAFVKLAAAKEGFDPAKVIALGYSNGANIAGATLVKHPGFLAGAILYRPMQPFREIKENRLENTIPVFFSSGRIDPTVNPADTQRYLDILQSMGYNVAFHDLNAGHNLIQDDVDLSAQWLNKNFS